MSTSVTTDPEVTEHVKPLGSGSCVLYIGNWWVEWLGVDRAGRMVHHRMEVEGEHPADFARAALQVIRKGGLGKRPCVLALADVHASERRVDVPPLKRNETQRVLHRKAAQHLKAELEETLYSARPARTQLELGEEADGSLKPWIVIGMRRQFVRDLASRLRRHGIRVRRTVSARSARLSTLIQAYGAPDDELEAKASELSDAQTTSRSKRKQKRGPKLSVGTVVVDVELHSISVHLVHGEDVITESTLSGSFEESPGLGVSLLQELRGLEAHWRKLSRGGRLGRVIFLGLSAASANRLAISLETALPSVEIVFLPDGDVESAAARKHSLAACTGAGPFDMDLSIQLPQRPLVLGLLFTVVAFLAGAAGVVAHSELSIRLADLEGRALALRETTSSLDELEARARGYRDSLEQLATETERARGVLRLGLPLEQLFSQTLQVLGRDAQLQALTATRSNDDHELRFSGRTHAHPLQALEALERIEHELAEIAYMSDIELQPPTLLLMDGASDARTPFEITARLAGFLPVAVAPKPSDEMMGTGAPQ